MKKRFTPIEKGQTPIHFIRGRQVMLDAELAELYGVSTKSLNLAVRRNTIRFPVDFMFRLTPAELRNLRFQSETSSWGGRRYLPYAFTEQGVAMLSSVLQSDRAALVNIAIMRAFVRLRHALASDINLAERLTKLENKVSLQDTDIRLILQDIRKLMGAAEASVQRADMPKIRGFSKGE